MFLDQWWHISASRPTTELFATGFFQQPGPMYLALNADISKSSGEHPSGGNGPDTGNDWYLRQVRNRASGRSDGGRPVERSSPQQQNNKGGPN